MEKTVSRFFELLRAGLWGTVPDARYFDESVDWDGIRTLARRQTVTGVVYDGMAQLESRLLPERKVMLQWFSDVVRIERMNLRMNLVLAEVVERFRQEGLNPVLLKGQGVAQYYRNPLRRQPGDIDLFFSDRYDRANEVAQRWVTGFGPDTSYHSSFEYKGIEVENHRVYVDFYHPRNRRKWAVLQRRLPLVGKESLRLGDFSVRVPAPQMNAVYLFLHLMHHFLQVGVGLRQVCDWACLWAARKRDIESETFGDAVDALGLRRPVAALAYVAEHFLGLPSDVIPVDTSTSQVRKDGERMCADILVMGNFGHDTDIMKGFRRNRHRNNMGAYIRAFKRQISLYGFFPSEVRAYPVVWLGQKIRAEIPSLGERSGGTGVS